jgi:cytochrome c-type biogenesis protein CcmE
VSEHQIPPRGAASLGSTKWFAIAALGVAALAFVAITVGGIGQNLVYYWGPKDIEQAGEKAYGATIRLGGMVAPGTVNFTKETNLLEFDVTDNESIVHVKGTGMPPAMFREGIGVVVEGTMVPGGYFKSNRLLVSHDNEYRTPHEGENYDAEKLIKSTDGVD